MTCPNCRGECRRYRRQRNGLQRFQCATCGKAFIEPHERPFGEMHTGQDRDLLAVRMLLIFCRIHQTRRIMPAMAAGIPDPVWDLEELLK